MFRRTLSLFLSALLMLGCIAGCKKSTSSENEGSSVKGTTSELPELEITSDEVIILTGGSQEYVDDPTTPDGFVNSILKEKYNCSIKIRVCSYEEVTQKAVQMILSDDAPDAVFFKMQDFPNFIINGMVDDISKYIDKNDEFWSYLDTNPLRYQGADYNCYTGVYNNGMTYFNRKMFANAGLETPYELFKRDEWTWKKFFELSKELTQDTDGDGTPDIYGGAVVPLYFYATCGDDFVTLNDDGTFANNMRSTKIANVMNFMHNLNSAGYNGGDIWQGTRAMQVDEVWELSVYADKFVDGTYGVAPSPRMSKDEPWYVNGGYNSLWLCKGAKNPGGALAFAAIQRWLDTSDEGKKLNAEYKKSYADYPEDIKDVQEWMANPENYESCLVRAAGVGNFGQASIFNMFNNVCQWGVPWSTEVEASYPVLQTQIDNVNVKLQTKDDF